MDRVSSSASVLIVDDSPDCREVLRTLLERRGVRTIEASGAEQGLDLLRQHSPDVVVLDMDSEAADEDGVRHEYDNQSQQQHTSLVILGKARRLPRQPEGRHVIPKPYHYAPLIRTIERLLGR